MLKGWRKAPSYPVSSPFAQQIQGVPSSDFPGAPARALRRWSPWPAKVAPLEVHLSLTPG